ncbi:MAG: O-antigen ligase family protein [Phaeodactylibacter sp.]|nr:O-antigen ligase family protein [Phaeodactylibacter sp.]
MIFTKEQHHAVFRYCMMLFCLGLPLHPRIATLSLVAALVNELLEGQWRQKLNGLKRRVPLLFFVFYALFLIGLSYSSNTVSALSSLETKLPFLVCPLLFFSRPPLDSGAYRRLLDAFILGCLSAALFCLAWAGGVYVQTGASTFFYKELSEHIGGHPTYMAMYTGLALFFVVNRLWQEGDWRQATLAFSLAVGLSLFFLVFLVLLSARMELLAIFLLLGLSLLVGMYQRQQLFRGLLLLGLSAVLLGAIVWSVPTTRQRFERALHSALHRDADDDGNVRWQIWDAAGSVLAQNNRWFGLGTGDVQQALDEAYAVKGYVAALEPHLNAHNQYYQLLLAIGLVGMLCWLLILALGFRIGIADSIPLLWFVALFALSCLTESMLESQRGTLFFCFFYCLFACCTPVRKKI